MNTPVPFFKLVLGSGGLALVLGLPSGITAWFDGLPWAGEMETVVLAIIIPFLLILGWRFLALRLPILLLSALLILKIVLFLGSPAGGWLVKVHPNLTQEQSPLIVPFQRHKGETWVNTYETSWNENASGILRQAWTEKLDFPLDWVLFQVGCGFSSVPCWNKLNPVIEIEGSVLLPEGKGFSLVAQGVQKGTLLALHESGESFILTPTKDIKDALEKQNQLPRSGRWRVSGKLHYRGTKWSLIPVLVTADGEIEAELGRGVLWQSEESLSSAGGQIGIYKYISFIIDIGIIVFLVAWVAWVTRLMICRQVLNLPLAIFSMSAICMPIFIAPIIEYILTIFGLSGHRSTFYYLGFSIFILGMGFLLWVFWQKDYRNLQTERMVLTVFLFFGPAILFFFADRWWPILGQWTKWGWGDDWSTYQYFARKIVVDGEWLLAGEVRINGTGVFRMQPLYRYFVGFYHWLFGQSAFVQNMADVWCVLGATVLLASWALKLRLSAFIIFITSTIYLAIILIGTIRYHIGRGLIEHHAMIFMVLAGWLLYGSHEGNFLRIIAAGICGVIGYWLRQDHLIVTVMLVFLIIEPTHGTTGEVWKAYWHQIWTHWRRGFSYVGIIVLGLFLMCFRNWWVGGIFAPTEKGHVMLRAFDLTEFYFRMKLMLTATHSATPNFATMVLLPGTFIGFVALIWRPNCLRSFPMAIGCALIGVFLPYVFFSNAGYPGRYSIHLLPLALLSTMIILDYFLKRVSFFKFGPIKNK